MNIEKQSLRKQARQHRDSIDPLTEDPLKAVELFFDIIKPTQQQTIAAYYPKGNEFDALSILEAAIEQDLNCALPVIEKDTRVMKFIQWSKAAQMTSNSFGIPEPIEDADHGQCDPDIIIVPLLAFDRKGTRLGQGGGYYDATLESLRKKKPIIAVGMCYSTQAVLFKLPKEEHDQPLDWVITPKEAHYFGK